MSTAPASCTHPATECYWQLDACTEEGWRCSCDADLGFRPDLDRELTEAKVDAILTMAHETDFLHVSNGTEGEIITAAVAQRCRQENRFDQLSILRFILEDPNINLAEHADYWQRRADGREPASPTMEEQLGPLLAMLEAKPKRPTRRQREWLQYVQEHGPQVSGIDGGFSARTTETCEYAGWTECRLGLVPAVRPAMMRRALTDAGRGALAAAKEGEAL